VLAAASTRRRERTTAPLDKSDSFQVLLDAAQQNADKFVATHGADQAQQQSSPLPELALRGSEQESATQSDEQQSTSSKKRRSRAPLVPALSRGLIKKDFYRMKTFATRRNSLVKKAAELSKLCRVNIGIIIERDPRDCVESKRHSQYESVEQMFHFSTSNLIELIGRYFRYRLTKTANAPIDANEHAASSADADNQREHEREQERLDNDDEEGAQHEEAGSADRIESHRYVANSFASQVFGGSVSY
jgi:hypothetical protein